MKDFRVELKICEGCGALFLRQAGLHVAGCGLYCRGCVCLLSEFPAPRPRGRRAQRRTAVRLAVCAGGAR
jgi:hypothetical protein